MKETEEVTSDSNLVAFLYILMRDHLPCGVVADIMKDHIDLVDKSTVSVFTNKHLARYAKEIAKKLGITE